MDNRTARKLLNRWKCSALRINFSDDRGWGISGLPVNTGWPLPDMVVFQPYAIGAGPTLEDAAKDALERSIPEAAK